MAFFQKIKNFFNKVDFDHSRSDITLYNYHPQIGIMLASLGIFFGNINPRVRLILPIFNLIIKFAAMITYAITLWHGIKVKDYGIATEGFSYLTVACTIPVFYISAIRNTNIILKIAEDMNNDFIEICALGPKYSMPFMKTQLKIWKLSLVWTTFLNILLQNYILFPMLVLVYQTLFVTQDENTVRPLPLPLWLPGVDIYATPLYEIILILQIYTTVICVHGYLVYICLLLHVLLHYYALMEMIILDFEVIFEGLDESVALLPKDNLRRVHAQTTLSERMKRIIMWHGSVLKVIDVLSLVFGPTLVYQLGATPFAVCLIAYQVAEKIDQGQFDTIYLILMTASLCQIAIPCYLGTLLRNKLFAVGDACWNCGWETTSLGRLLRLDIMIFILRCQIPVSIKFVGLPSVELETFSAIVTSSYSYFNMLRQYSKK